MLAHAREVAAELGQEPQDYASGDGSYGDFNAAIAPKPDERGVDEKGARLHLEPLRISSLARIAALHLHLLETRE